MLLPITHKIGHVSYWSIYVREIRWKRVGTNKLREQHTPLYNLYDNYYFWHGKLQTARTSLVFSNLETRTEKHDPKGTLRRSLQISHPSHFQEGAIKIVHSPHRIENCCSLNRILGTRQYNFYFGSMNLAHISFVQYFIVTISYCLVYCLNFLFIIGNI